MALLMIALVQSQTHRFIYELQYKMDSTETTYEKLNMILDITPKEVKFYGRNLMMTDSLNKKFGMNTSHTDMSGQVVNDRLILLRTKISSISKMDTILLKLQIK
jgi:GLPGLI family protein